MFQKLAVLKLKLGYRHNDITLRDIQLWNKVEDVDGENNDSMDNEAAQLTAKFVTSVDMSCLPLWAMDYNGDVENGNYCFTSSGTSLSYFESKLKYPNRGIVITLNRNSTNEDKILWKIGKKKLSFPNYIIFYQANNYVHYITIDPTIKTAIDVKIDFLEKDISNKEIKIMSINSEKKLDEYSDLNKDPVNKIEIALKKTYQQNRINNNKIIRSLQLSDKRLQFNETLSKVILGGLRLRGIPNTQIGFQKLYKITFESAEFALRDELNQLSHNLIQEISFVKIQETVEILLNLFTKT